LRNARGPELLTTGCSELGASIAAFAELVAVMQVTGSLVDGDVLRALILRLAELLGESVPPGL
jgi:hypothetical protein